MAKKSPPDISPVMKTLATYIAQAGKKPLPANVVERTKHHLLDTLAAMVSGIGNGSIPDEFEPDDVVAIIQN